MTLGGTNITIVSNAIYSIDTEEIDLYLSAGEMENVTNGNYWKY